MGILLRKVKRRSSGVYARGLQFGQAGVLALVVAMEPWHYSKQGSA
jgi:hypothetical protein